MLKVSRKKAGSFIEDISAILTRLANAETGNSDADLQGKFRQHSKPPIIELGNPVPDPSHLPYRRAARCPASHNRLLLGELGDESPAERARHSSSRARRGRSYSPAEPGVRRVAESSSA